MSEYATLPKPELEALTPLARLAQHLREHPSAIDEPPKELASRFGLPESLVADVQDALKTRDLPLQLDQLWQSAGLVVFRLWNQAVALFVRLTDRPTTFLLVTTLIALVVAVLGGQTALVADEPAVRGVVGQVLQGITGSVVLATLGLHLLCYARHGKLQQPLSVGFAGLAAFVPMLVVFWWTAHARGQPNAHVLLYALLVAAFVLVGLYTSLGMVASLIGGYAKLRRESHARERLTRPELLDRLFFVDERLRQAHVGNRPLRRSRSRLIWARQPSHYWPLALSVGLSLGLVDLLTLGALAEYAPGIGGQGTLLNGVLSLTLSIVGLAVYGLLAYVSGSVHRAVPSVLAAAVLADVPRLIPLGFFGPEYVLRAYSSWQWLVVGAVLTLVAATLGFAAVVEERARRERKLHNDDPAALVAELVRLHWRLQPGSQSTCVLVVDVAKSRSMKSEEDPLVVEWSFREFQRRVEQVCHDHGGVVLNTTGDGAVTAFQGSQSALGAAKAIQNEVARFNIRGNKLAKPFRVRIGLHAGKVAGGLNEVQFNEVIDVAAHIEEIATAGGIALTEAVAAELSDEPLTEIKRTVDGFQVFFVVNPTTAP